MNMLLLPYLLDLLILFSSLIYVNGWLFIKSEFGGDLNILSLFSGVATPVMISTKFYSLP